MSVASTIRKQQFTLDQVTTEFDFTFRAIDAAPTDIKCRVYNGGTTGTLTYTTDYTADVEEDGIGGTVTLIDAGAVSLGTLTVYRVTTNTQSSDYEDYNQFPADTLEGDLDRRTLLSQETAEDVVRSLKLDVTQDMTSIDATIPVPAKGDIFGWDTAGTSLIRYDNPATAFASATSEATTATSEATTATAQAAIAASEGTSATSSAATATSSATVATSEATTVTASIAASASSATTSASHATTSSDFATVATSSATVSTSEATTAVAQVAFSESHATTSSDYATVATSSATVSTSESTTAVSSAATATSSATVATSEATTAAGYSAALSIGTLTFIIDGGGSAIATGIKGDLRIPFACDISSITLLADQSTSTVIDIWKDTYANFPPDNTDTITASSEGTISAAVKSEDTDIFGWTTSIDADDILRFNVDSNDNAQRITLALKVER